MPLWSTRVPEPEWLRPGKCIQPRAGLRQFPAEHLEPKQCRQGKHTRHERGQTQCGRVTVSTCQCYLFAVFFPGGSEGKVSAYNAGDLGSIPGLGRSPGEGNDSRLQYSRLENPMDCSLPGSPVREILQARILEWAVISFSRGSSPPRDRTEVFHIGRQILYH